MANQRIWGDIHLPIPAAGVVGPIIHYGTSLLTPQSYTTESIPRCVEALTPACRETICNVNGTRRGETKDAFLQENREKK